MKVKSESEVTQSCPTLHDPMDCSPPGSSAHGIFQARVLEWVAIAFFYLSPRWDQILDPSWNLVSVMENALNMLPNAYSSPFPARANSKFLALHHENLVGFLKEKTMKM